MIDRLSQKLNTADWDLQWRAKEQVHMIRSKLPRRTMLEFAASFCTRSTVRRAFMRPSPFGTARCILALVSWPHAQKMRRRKWAILRGVYDMKDCDPKEIQKGREHWLSSKPCDVILNERGFLIDVASDPTFVADKIVEPRVTLLRKHGQEMVSLDTAL